MKEILERLLTENNEMIMESPLIGDDNYRVGYVQALLNMKSSIEFELEAHPSPLHAFFITFQKYIQNIAKKR
jgi:hypothetical protein